MSNWNAIVEGCFPGARVRAAEPLAGDASTRRYVRLRLEGDGAPETAIGMLLPEPTAGGAPELPFLSVGRALAAHGVPVPTVYAAHDRATGQILLEDVGDISLAAALLSPTASRAQVDRLLEDTADLLARLAAVPASSGCVAFTRSHDEALVQRETRLIYQYGLAESDEGPRRMAPDPEAERVLADLGEAICAQPRRLMHRDFHAWNLHVDATGTLRVIDFQDAMLGPPTYDLASLCTDRDSDRVFSPDRETRLLGHYHAALARHGVDLYTDPNVLRRDYLHCVLFRTLRVIGRFRQLAIDDGIDRYLAYLPRMARQTLRAAEALDAEPLRKVLTTRSAVFA